MTNEELVLMMVGVICLVAGVVIGFFFWCWLFSPWDFDMGRSPEQMRQRIEEEQRIRSLEEMDNNAVSIYEIIRVKDDQDPRGYREVRVFKTEMKL